MLEKPDLDQAEILAFVQSTYGLDVSRVNFLPLGYDVRTAIYRVETHHDQAYFLKIRLREFDPIAVTLPHFLHQELSTVIAPLKTGDGRLFGKMGQYTTILYPFIQGKDGYAVRLADDQWIELGRTLRIVHHTRLPGDLLSQIPRETYDPQWRQCASEFLIQIDHASYADPIASKLAAFMRSKRSLISQMLERGQVLAELLQEQSPEFVVCHNDAHPGNFLLTDVGELYLVDWDNPIIAPKERDLMCIGGGMSGDQPGGREERLFYQGYGMVQLNLHALAYYRFERIIQDIVEFSRRILLTNEGGEDRAQSYQYFASSFEPRSVVDAAFQADQLAADV